MAAAVALAVSAVLGASSRIWRGRLETVEPARRVPWLLALLAAPPVTGGLTLGVALGPCVRAWALGLPDDCFSHGGPTYFFCLLHPAHASHTLWALAALCVLPLVVQGARVSLGLARLRRLAARLRMVASPTDDPEVWLVPGRAAFAMDWPRRGIYLGRDLRLRPALHDAILAHERAHVRRGDLGLRLVAWMLTALHAPGVGTRLEDALDLAIEQACDAEASGAVGDPLVVAEALLAVTRLDAPPPDKWLAAFGPHALEARVRALCDPPWCDGDPRARGRNAVALASLAFAVLVGLDRPLHDAVEAVVALLAN
ncbi:MAG: hypothetical protein EPO40_01860 [Myxococcaceae bacterium]|nr:MAG: hypothetical protein EPO40_01860 [Myxococcaceae bacterium]